MTAPGPLRHRRVRGVTAAVLVVVASLLLSVGLLTLWLREQVIDTNAFVSTAGKVARDPAVEREVSEKVSTALIRQLDIEPDEPGGLGAETVIRRATAVVVASDRFESLWEVAVRGAHTNGLRLAEGESIAGVETRNGRIAVNLDPVVDAVVAQLPGPIAALIPPVTTGDDIVLFRSSDLASGQPVVRVVDDGWLVVPFLSLVLFAAAVTIASRRRRAVLWVGGGIVVASVVTLIGLLVGRQRLVDAVDTRAARVATSAVFDVVVEPLRTELWIIVGIGVALAASAVVAGFLEHPQRLPVPVDGLVDEGTSGQAPPSCADRPIPSVEPATSATEATPEPQRRDAEPSEPSREPTSTPRRSG